MVRLALAACLLLAAESVVADPLKLETADGHPMQYYVSLPRAYSGTRSYPVVVVVEAAEKQFAANAARLVAARGDLPFIIVAPIVVTNGRSGQRDPAVYPYAVETWDRIDKDGVCAFDLDGLARVLDKVRRSYRGEERIFITGFEAGAHLVWAYTLRHPEKVRAAAPVAGNYIGRCVEESQISRDPARRAVPIRGFIGERDPLWGPAAGNHGQFEAARKVATEHGFGAVSEAVVPNQAHVPMPAEVMRWFAELAR